MAVTIRPLTPLPPDLMVTGLAPEQSRQRNEALNNSNIIYKVNDNVERALILTSNSTDFEFLALIYLLTNKFYIM